LHHYSGREKRRRRRRNCEERAMKISARNVLKGTVVDVKKGATTAHVRIDVGGTILTASITNESADELKLAKGKTAFAIIKASSVMVGVE
jgi:molybdopterin-binding protein